VHKRIISAVRVEFVSDNNASDNIMYIWNGMHIMTVEG
jgi:hypothetical protein